MGDSGPDKLLKAFLLQPDRGAHEVRVPALIGQMNSACRWQRLRQKFAPNHEPFRSSCSLKKPSDSLLCGGLLDPHAD